MNAKEKVFIFFGGIVFTVGPLGFAWLEWTDIEKCRAVLEKGVEETATVTDQTQTVHYSRGRKRVHQFTEVRFGPYYGFTKFAVQGPDVPIIHEPLSEDDKRSRPGVIIAHSVLVGRKSDGLFSVFSANYGWIPVVFWTFANVFFVPIGLLMVVLAFVPNKTQKVQQPRPSP